MYFNSSLSWFFLSSAPLALSFIEIFIPYFSRPILQYLLDLASSELLSNGNIYLISCLTMHSSKRLYSVFETSNIACVNSLPLHSPHTRKHQFSRWDSPLVFAFCSDKFLEHLWRSFNKSIIFAYLYNNWYHKCLVLVVIWEACLKLWQFRTSLDIRWQLLL